MALRAPTLLPLSACVLLGSLAAQGERPPREPSAREIAREATREIKAALKEDSVTDVYTVFRLYGLIDDTDVVRAVGKGVTDDRSEVRWAAVITLRYNPNKKAASELMSAARKKQILVDERLTAEVFRGIGQHGDARALSLMAQGFGPGKEAGILTSARIDAVGRMRTPSAVNTLIKYARSGFAKGEDLQARIATALAGLTGESLGMELRPWVLWWNRAKLGYRFPENPPRPPAAWTQIWEVPAPDQMFNRIPGTGNERGSGAPVLGEPERGRGRGRLPRPAAD